MKQFTINKGKHYCTSAWKKFFRPRWGHDKWLLSFILTEDCWWAPPRNQDDFEDINKLYGCGFGSNHHKNSWRLGWIPVFTKKNCFSIYAYVYDKTGQHIAEELGEVKANKACTVSVEVKDKKYWFSCLDLGQQVCLPNEHKDCKLQFDLHPYHGGNNTAPQKETFFIDYKPK